MHGANIKTSFQGVIEHLVNFSSIKTWIKMLNNLFVEFYELKLNIKTRPDLLTDESLSSQQDLRTKFQNGIGYKSPRYFNLLKIAKKVRGWGPGGEIFYDIGSGKGRLLCVMARFPLRKVVGVEVQPALCERGKANTINLKRRIAEMEIGCKDGITSDLSDGNIYFFFIIPSVPIPPRQSSITSTLPLLSPKAYEGVLAVDYESF